MWEIYAYHNSDSLFGIFNAIAAIVGSNGYIGSLAIVVLFGFLGAALGYALAPEKLEGWRWLATLVLVYSVLLVPRVTVGIVDKTGGTPVKVVANVPFGVAAFGSVTSSVGNVLTELFETAFQVLPGPAQLPAELAYQQHGMMFGSKVLKETTSLAFLDPEFRTDVVNFVHNCTMFDLNDGSINPSAFSKSPDLWALMATTNPARFTTINTAGVSSVMTCSDAYSNLNGRMPAHLTSAQVKLAIVLNPAIAPALANAAVANQVQQTFVRNQIGTAALTVSDYIRQGAMINAINDSSQLTGQRINDPASLMLAMGRAQATAQYNAAGINASKLAEQTLPIFRNTVEAITYALFPVMILLVLLTNGRGAVMALKSYGGVLLWIQMWPLLYAVLNYMASLYYAMEYSALADVGGTKALSLETASLIYSGSISAQSVVGKLVFSVPFIAWALVKRFETLGTAMMSGLSSLDSTVSSSTSSSTLGNVSSGQVSFDKIQTAPHIMSANFGSYQDDKTGAIITKSADGRVMAMQALMNRTPMGRSVASAASVAAEQRATKAVESATADLISASEERSAVLAEGVLKGRESIDTSRLGTGYSSSEQTDLQQMLQNAKNTTKNLAEKLGTSEEIAAHLGFNAALGVGSGGPDGSAGGAIRKHFQSGVDRRYDKVLQLLGQEGIQQLQSFAKRYASDQNFQRAVARSDRDSADLSARLQNSNSELASKSATYAERQSAMEEASLRRAEEERFSYDAWADPANFHEVQEALRLANGSPGAAMAHFNTLMAQKTMRMPTKMPNGAAAPWTGTDLREHHATQAQAVQEQSQVDRNWEESNFRVRPNVAPHQGPGQLREGFENQKAAAQQAYAVEDNKQRLEHAKQGIVFDYLSGITVQPGVSENGVQMPGSLVSDKSQSKTVADLAFKDGVQTGINVIDGAVDGAKAVVDGAVDGAKALADAFKNSEVDTTLPERAPGLPIERQPGAAEARPESSTSAGAEKKPSDQRNVAEPDASNGASGGGARTPPFDEGAMSPAEENGGTAAPSKVQMQEVPTDVHSLRSDEKMGVGALSSAAAESVKAEPATLAATAAAIGSSVVQTTSAVANAAIAGTQQWLGDALTGSRSAPVPKAPQPGVVAHTEQVLAPLEGSTAITNGSAATQAWAVGNVTPESMQHRAPVSAEASRQVGPGTTSATLESSGAGQAGTADGVVPSIAQVVSGVSAAVQATGAMTTEAIEGAQKWMGDSLSALRAAQVGDSAEPAGAGIGSSAREGGAGTGTMGIERTTAGATRAGATVSATPQAVERSSPAATETSAPEIGVRRSTADGTPISAEAVFETTKAFASAAIEGAAEWGGDALSASSRRYGRAPANGETDVHATAGLAPDGTADSTTPLAVQRSTAVSTETVPQMSGAVTGSETTGDKAKASPSVLNGFQASAERVEGSITEQSADLLKREAEVVGSMVQGMSGGTGTRSGEPAGAGTPDVHSQNVQSRASQPSVVEGRASATEPTIQEGTPSVSLADQAGTKIMPAPGDAASIRPRDTVESEGAVGSGAQPIAELRPELDAARETDQSIGNRAIEVVRSGSQKIGDTIDHVSTATKQGMQAVGSAIDSSVEHVREAAEALQHRKSDQQGHQGTLNKAGPYEETMRFYRHPAGGEPGAATSASPATAHTLSRAQNTRSGAEEMVEGNGVSTNMSSTEGRNEGTHGGTTAGGVPTQSNVSRQGTINQPGPYESTMQFYRHPAGGGEGVPPATSPTLPKVDSSNSVSGKPDVSNLVLHANERYRDAVLTAARTAKLHPSAIAALAQAEASKVEGGPNDGMWRADSKNSAKGQSATGITQFTDGTWLMVSSWRNTPLNARARSEGFIDSKNRRVDEAGILGLRYDGELSILTAGVYAKHNLKQLDDAKLISPNMSDDDKARLAYIAHHEGAAGAIAFLRGAVDENEVREKYFANVRGTNRHRYSVGHYDSHVEALVAFRESRLGGDADDAIRRLSEKEATRLYRSEVRGADRENYSVGRYDTYGEAYAAWLTSYVNNKVNPAQFRR